MDRRKRTSSGNLGHVSLPLRSRSTDPMADFDALPAALRQWVAQADLPWSPASCLRLWRKYRARGIAPDQVLCILSDLQARMLDSDHVKSRQRGGSGKREAYFPDAGQNKRWKDITCVPQAMTNSVNRARFWA